MKIVLTAFNTKFVHSNLAIYDIEAYTRKKWASEGRAGFFGQNEPNGSLQTADEDFSKKLVQKEFTINHNLDNILQELYQEKANVYAFACYIWNIYEILTIAKELKKVLPACVIWLGGPEVSYDAQKYLLDHPYIEGIILGEGEVTFYELTKVWERKFRKENPLFGSCQNQGFLSEAFLQEHAESEGLEPKDYPEVCGIIYRDGLGNIEKTGKRPLMELDELPFVYEDLTPFTHKILYYETSRGCPFSCSYCLSSIDKAVRFRSFSLVKKELDFFLAHRVPQVKLVDRTFNCNRAHALEIWKYLEEHDNGVTNFHFEVAADLIEEEELTVFQRMRPGLIQLEIGLQSTNPQTIREIRRRMDVEKVKRTIATIRTFGNIHQHLDLIAGLPYEDYASFQKSFNDAYRMMPNQLQLGFLKVLKGSYMGEQKESYELTYRDVQPFEVLSTRWISYDEILILKMVEEMVEVYYNSDQFEHVLPFVISEFSTPFAFFEELGMYYKERELFGIGFKREARYQALREFYRLHCLKLSENNIDSVASEASEENRKLQKQGMIFDSLLTFDYYLRENVKTRPGWAKEEPIDKEVYQNFFRSGGNQELSLRKEGYDSKVAARMMHIEPIAEEALPWIKEGERTYHYCLFDYGDRNPLTKDARVYFLKGLE